MDTVKNVLLSYIVKLLVPQSPAYGNTIPFVKQQKIDSLISKLEPGDIIFTKTNNSWYEVCRRIIGSNYDHVSVVLNKNQVIHISPPIISKINIQQILSSSRQPTIVRLPLEPSHKQSMLNILNSFLGEKYDQAVVIEAFKNEIFPKMMRFQKEYDFSFQNMKYSKICSEAILYSICKGSVNFQENLVRFVNQKSTFKTLGLIKPDQVLNFLTEIKGSQILYKSQNANQNQKMLLIKSQKFVKEFTQKMEVVIDFYQKIGNTKSISILVQVMKYINTKLITEHPLIKILSLIIFLYQWKSGGFLRKNLILVVKMIHFTLNLLILWRVFPQAKKIVNTISSKL